MGWFSRRRAEPSGKDKPFRWSSTTLNLGLRDQAYLYLSLYIGSIFIWEVPVKYLKVFTFPVLLGNTTMFVCKLPIRLLLTVGRVHYVFHASLISDFLVWGFYSLSLFMSLRLLFGHIRRLVSDVVDNNFALLHCHVYNTTVFYLQCSTDRVVQLIVSFDFMSVCTCG